MTLRAYRIPENIDASGLPWQFEGERAIKRCLDVVEVDGSIDGYPEIPVVTPTTVVSVDQIKAEIVTKTQERLDTFAQTRGYDNILSACTYVASAMPKFAAEGQYAVNVRDITWTTLYSFMAEVLAGTKPMPMGYADIEPILPVLAWPI